MKIKHILAYGLLILAGTTSCSEFLDTDTESKYEDDYVFGSEDEIDRALNGVYNKLLDDDTYGKAYYTTFCLNSDVEFTTNSNPLRAASGNEFKAFDCTPSASALNKTWTAAYSNIEYANNFITGASASELFRSGDSTVLQKIGEAKVIRAMNYHDMVVLFGDVPFKLERSYDNPHDLITPIVGRDEILKTLIDDLRKAAPDMEFARDLDGGVRRVSKEFCWAMIARMSLTYAGYSLRPGASASDKGTMQRPEDYREYYKIAMDYADSVIQSNTHALNKKYHEVFIDECNYKRNDNDDPIFEIPFTKTLSGNVGYSWGPKVEDKDGETPHVWGKCDGSVTLNIFYRWDFDEKDLRLNYMIPLWSYNNSGEAVIRSDAFTSFCGKWSKLWQDESTAMGALSAANTGIAFPYMRYADVLLMYAEAQNEYENGPNAAAKEALKTVRRRAFAEDQATKVDAYVDAAGDKDSFFQLIMDERKFEFGGEGLRWRDLVRWNKYAEVIRDVFYKYYGVATEDYSYAPDMDKYLMQIFYRKIDNNQGYDYTTFGSIPNSTLAALDIYNPLHPVSAPKDSEIKDGDTWLRPEGATTWENQEFLTQMQKDGAPDQKACYSLRGYIVGDEFGGTPVPDLFDVPAEQLPVVRYILPIPQSVISRSQGTYTNAYGYR